jgi:O-antigen ligase
MWPMWMIISLLIGYFIIHFSPVAMLALLGGGIVFYVTVKHPEYAVFGVVVLLSSILFEEDLPLVPIPGIGSLHVSDILVLFLLCKISYNIITDEAYKFLITPLCIPLALFLLMTVFSTYNAISISGLYFNTVVRELRFFCYYLIYFVIIGLFRERTHLVTLIKGLFAIALFVTLAMIAQAGLGDSVQLMSGRVEAVETFDAEFGSLRILPPGQTLIYMFFITSLCMTVLIKTGARTRLKYVGALVLLGAGVMLTYNRVYWVSIAIAAAVLMMLALKSERRRLLNVVAASVAFLLCLLVAFNLLGGKYAESAAAVSSRFTSVFAGKELTQSSSMGDRVIENEYALKTIEERPLLGSGLRTIYRPNIYGDEDTLNYYVHNAYLWFMKDVGIIGLALFLWFFVGIIYRGMRNFNHIKDEYLRAVLAGFVLSSLGFLPMSFINPVYMQWFSIVCIAITSGIVDMIIYLNDAVPELVALNDADAELVDRERV